MQTRDTFTSNATFSTLCSRCHHSEFVHSDPTGGTCLFSECKCPDSLPSLRGRTPERQTVS
jgi:hypothetical protein